MRLITTTSESNPHKFFRLHLGHRVGTVNFVIKEIYRSVFKLKRSIYQLRKIKQTMHANWKWPEPNHHKTEKTKPFNYKILKDYIQEHGEIDYKSFNFPLSRCIWLDDDINQRINFHLPETDQSKGMKWRDGTVKRNFGENFPIEPAIDREGFLFTTFLPRLMKRVMNQRTSLIENSEKIFEDEWLFNFKELINNSISLVDMTLNLIYIKAEFDPLPKWKFDKSKLGEKYGVKFKNKLKWVYQISGNHLCAEKYYKSLMELKDLRNHLNHFDPPCLVMTFEEIGKWLNQIVDIGFFLVKIRQALNLEVSEDILNLILQKDVIFIPEIPSNRIKLNSSEYGYQSSTWK